MTPDFPTAPPAYGLEGPSAGRTVEKSQPASHTEFLTLPRTETFSFTTNRALTAKVGAGATAPRDTR